MSVEHIIPESLGNKDHVLEKGIVCDKCNQYFARKVEKPLLDTLYFKHVRHRNDIESKKGRIPCIDGVIGGRVALGKDKDGIGYIDIPNPKVINKILSGQAIYMIIPKVDDPVPDDKNMSRFLAKVAIETLALRFFPTLGWNEAIVDKKELDFLRDYARYGNKPKFWEYSQRRIYEESDRFYNPELSPYPYEVLHELDVRYLKKRQLYLIVTIMGVEFVINYTNPYISGYKEWLSKNNNESPIEQDEARRKIHSDSSPYWIGRKFYLKDEDDFTA